MINCRLFPSNNLKRKSITPSHQPPTQQWPPQHVKKQLDKSLLRDLIAVPELDHHRDVVGNIGRATRFHTLPCCGRRLPGLEVIIRTAVSNNLNQGSDAPDSTKRPSRRFYFVPSNRNLVASVVHPPVPALLRERVGDRVLRWEMFWYPFAQD